MVPLYACLRGLGVDAGWTPGRTVVECCTMNTLAFRRAGTSSRLVEQLRQSGASLPGPNLSRSGVALIAGATVVAVALAGFLIIGASEPDPTQTAAVPPRVTLPQTASAAPPVARDEKSAAAVEPRQPAKSALSAAPPISGETPKAHFSPSPPVAANLPDSAAGPDERSGGPVANAGLAAAPDTADTASIAPDGLRGSLDVQVAETEAEIAMLEASTGMVDANAVGAIEPPLPELSPAKAAKYANLRDGPADEANVIVVVPANAAIEAETSCNWCTVVYNGQRGYMFKSLIRRSVKEEAAAGQGLF
ncbi:SH3 domain-containing protein [Aminobacter sp. DSM 101952]|nr:SH3 domain-containing protein [Aminobacter sp. DSM 101952]